MSLHCGTHVMKEKEFEQRILEALENALNGLIWYQSNHPEDVEECDLEVVQEIGSVIESLKENIK